MHLRDVIRGSIGPWQDRCDGYSNPGASGKGYITALALQMGKAKQGVDPTLDQIVAYDRASANATYTGQINVLQATSFSGVCGAIWGYDVVRASGIDTAAPLFDVKNWDGQSVPVFDAAPLFEAGRALFGTRTDLRFRILPGALVSAAIKGSSAIGPCCQWVALSLSIADDRERASSLFLEDSGTIPIDADPSVQRKATIERMARTAVAVAENNRVSYRAIYTGFDSQLVQEGEIGGVKAVAPYVVLARNAVPDSDPDLLLRMTLPEWERAVRFNEGSRT